MADLVTLKNVSKVYSRGLLTRTSTTALAGVSLSIGGSEPTVLTVAGESGSGKTTLAMLLLGIIAPTTGQILYQGTDITQLRGLDKVAFRREVQAVFQDPYGVFNPFYTVDHLLSVPIAKFRLAKSKRDARDRMDEALNAVGLRPEDVLGRFPHQLSGGQRQRINVARALVLRPRVLVADEPVSMVDASLRATILETLLNLQKLYGVSIIYITHDLTTAFHLSRSIIVLYRGAVMEAGQVDAIIKTPQHPYTRLLVDSIPWPDLDRPWGSTEIAAPMSNQAENNVGCPFQARCPVAMAKCGTPAPLFRISEHQAAACYLFDQQPPVAAENLSDLLPV